MSELEQARPLAGRDLSGYSCLVTGAGKGLGRVIARSFLTLGARVAFVSRTSYDDVLDEVDAAGDRALFVRADVSKAADVSRAFLEVSAAFGGLDVLVNNAGIATPGSLMDGSLEDWDQVMANNVRSCFMCIRAAVPMLRESERARIVNVSSIAGRDKSILLGPAYTTSKAALIGLTRHAAAELGPHSIRVNCICPGQHYTPMLNSVLTPALEARVKERVPLGYIAAPEEIAAVVVFLASAASGYMTGAIVDVNGGQL